MTTPRERFQEAVDRLEYFVATSIIGEKESEVWDARAALLAMFDESQAEVERMRAERDAMHRAALGSLSPDVFELWDRARINHLAATPAAGGEETKR